MRHRLFATFTLVLSLAAVCVAPAPAVERTSAADCPAYVAHLLRSGELLRFGDRASALEEIRQARAALAACAREGDGETALAMSAGFGRPTA